MARILKGHRCFSCPSDWVIKCGLFFFFFFFGGEGGEGVPPKVHMYCNWPVLWTSGSGLALEDGWMDGFGSGRRFSPSANSKLQDPSLEAFGLRYEIMFEIRPNALPCLARLPQRLSRCSYKVSTCMGTHVPAVFDEKSDHNPSGHAMAPAPEHDAVPYAEHRRRPIKTA